MKNLLCLSTFLFLLTLSCEHNEDTYIPKANQAPSKFEINHLIVDEKVVTISWTESVDPDGDEVSYTIFKDNNILIAEDIKSTFYVFANLEKGTQYNGKIVASDGKGKKVEVPYSFITKKSDNNSQDDGNNNLENFNIPTEIKSYYKGTNLSLRGDDLKNDLATLIIGTHKTFLEYGERHKYLKRATDPSNPNNILLIYNGESISKNSKAYNTEHVFPRSKLDKNNGEPNDIHNFYYCRESINSSRGNKKFTQGSGKYKNSTNYWYPGDDWRGDVARIIFYMNLRYDEPLEDVVDNDITILLDWNIKDPVSEIEKKRNDIFQNAQGNRNPFIDNPYFATLIWGGEKAENRWK